MADKLKPCPFCGGKAEQLPQCNGGFFVIRCPLCDIRVYRPSRGEALAAWNNRVPATDQFPIIGKMVTMPPEYKVNPNYQNLGKNHFCASCGVMFIDWENAPTNYCGNCGQKLREVQHEND